MRCRKFEQHHISDALHSHFQSSPISSSQSIRLATPIDAPALAEFAERMFRATFGPDNAQSDMDAYCVSAFGTDIQKRELSDAARVCVMVEYEGVLAAFAWLQIGATHLCVVGEHPVEIQRFYVDQRWHGTGLAQQLMQAAMAEALARGAQTAWLGVWDRNVRAIRFYEKLGFHDVGSHVFLLGQDAQTDRILLTTLSR